MIVLDIETTGLDARIHQIVSIGAVNTETGATFYQECCIYPEDVVDAIALKVNGFSEEELRSNSKITPVELYNNLVEWCSGNNLIMTCNVSFDLSFLRKVYNYENSEYNKFPFRRVLDLYSIYYTKTRKLESLKNMCINLGIEPEPEIHNALTGAEKAYACLTVLLSMV